MKDKLYPENPILIIDDETATLKSYEISLMSVGINNIICCKDSREAMKYVERQDIELIVLDLIMPYISGKDILKRLLIIILIFRLLWFQESIKSKKPSNA